VSHSIPKATKARRDGGLFISEDAIMVRDSNSSGGDHESTHEIL
jgi:hypothetical protein